MNTLTKNIQMCCRQPAQKTDRGWEKEYIFPQSFLGFQGHFPGRPILPAVVQVMIFRESIAEKLNQNLVIATMTRAKFLKVINPETPVTAIWTLKETEGQFLCKCLLESEGERASSFNLTLIVSTE
jgi:3-hydroxyacyl-[acyl-carrier-protein] dehydratase